MGGGASALKASAQLRGRQRLAYSQGERYRVRPEPPPPPRPPALLPGGSQGGSLEEEETGPTRPPPGPLPGPGG